MRRSVAALIAASAIALSGCYHAIIDTGRTASTEVITKPWANSFIFGLVPPPVLETSQQCKNGVAKVETQHSFLNGLAAVVTFSLYTPMTITVTCARGTAVLPGTKILNVGSNAEAAFNSAIELARETGAPVYLKF